MSDITNRDDIIDSRNVVERITELKTEIDDYERDVDAGVGAPVVLEDLREQLTNLEGLDKEGRSTFGDSTWEGGVTMIRDTYFEEYAREFAQDIGAISNDMQWPATCIDWDQAAKELAMDYTTIEFNGQEYEARE